MRKSWKWFALQTDDFLRADSTFYEAVKIRVSPIPEPGIMLKSGQTFKLTALDIQGQMNLCYQQVGSEIAEKEKRGLDSHLTPLALSGGVEGTRTLGLRRDRPAL